MPAAELVVGAPAHGGHCVARHEGRVVFVRHAIPGERVVAEFTETGADARFWRADAVEILEASPDRVSHPWPEAGPGGVGGAELGHVSLPAQRRWKGRVLDESFERFAGREFPGEVRAVPGAPEGLRWRTRVTATADADGRAAMHVHRSEELRALEAMPLATRAVEEALLAVRADAGAGIVVATGSRGEPVVLVDDVPRRGARPDTRPNARRRVVHEVENDHGQWEFTVDATGFWQVHVGAAEALLSEVLRRVEPDVPVLDLYAGAGLFAVPLATLGHRVTAVEADAGAVRSARRNAHDASGLEIVRADTRRFLQARDAGLDHTVVLDPPRSGAGRGTLDALTALEATRLVYVACDPVALARDTRLLTERGYDLVDATALDMFPMTHHVETVAFFSRRTGT